MATLAMSLVTIIAYNGLGYINVTGNVNTIITICIAVVAYIAFTLMFGVLNSDEIAQLPYGNKICKVLKNKKKK